MVQLNIYVPKEKRHILLTLNEVAKASNRSKNDIVLEALERYLPTVQRRALGKYDLGKVTLAKRCNIYEERLTHDPA